MEMKKNVPAGIRSLDATEEETHGLEGRMIGIIQNEAQRQQSLEKASRAWLTWGDTEQSNEMWNQRPQGAEGEDICLTK